MTRQDARAGGTNFVKMAEQVTPGGSGDIDTLVTTTNNVPIATEKLKAAPEMINEKVALSSRFSNAIKEPGRVKSAGPVTYYMNPALGLDFAIGALGASTTLSAIAPVVTSVDATTTDNVTSLTAVGAWLPGAHVLVNCASGGAETAATYHRTVLRGSTSGHLKVIALENDPTLTAGAYCTQPAQTKIANSLLASDHVFELPMYTVEANRGRQYSLVYGAIFVDKLGLTYGNKGSIVAQADLLSAFGYPELALAADTSITMGTFNPSTQDLLDALRPWNDSQTTAVYVCDPDGTGASTLQAADITGLKIEYDNKCIEDPVLNNIPRYLYTPGDEVGCKVSWSFRNTSKRNSALDDLLRLSIATPLQVLSSRNNGTAAVPVHRGLSVYAPYCKLDMSDEDTAIGKTNALSISGEAMPEPGGLADLIQIYIL